MSTEMRGAVVLCIPGYRTDPCGMGASLAGVKQTWV